jgi:tetratricopeptide (TPR) repeat protein
MLVARARHAAPAAFTIIISIATIPAAGQRISDIPKVAPGVVKQTPVRSAPGAEKNGIPPDAAKAAKLFEQALADQRAGRIERAIAAYKQILTFAPNAYPVCVNLGLIYQARGDLNSAET